MVARRLIWAPVLLLVVTALSFVLVSLTPGDAARQILGVDATPESYANLRAQLGLDLPLYEQYGNWLTRLFTGDLGTSLFSGESVTALLNQRLPVTLSLVAGAILVSLVVGVGIGVLSAVRGGSLGRAVDVLALVGFAVPAFWLGALLISWFAVDLEWFPATGYVALDESPIDWLKSILLPVIALSVSGVAAIAKQTREAMLDALGSEYIRVAHANGIAPGSIYLQHALKNAGIRVITVTGVQAVSLLGGTVVIENVFALPGLGSLAVNATLQHDIPVIQGVIVYFTVMVIVVNLVIDLAYGWINPRVGLDG